MMCFFTNLNAIRLGAIGLSTRMPQDLAIVEGSMPIDSGKVRGWAGNSLDGLPLILRQQVAHLCQPRLLMGPLEFAQRFPAPKLG